jgi:hypothetical protein
MLFSGENVAYIHTRCGDWALSVDLDDLVDEQTRDQDVVAGWLAVSRHSRNNRNHTVYIQ